ncbi:MAG TPA: GtrA family protein [Microlunatus sp.]|nr:GtrA family protein [Microlunatus sp.]
MSETGARPSARGRTGSRTAGELLRYLLVGGFNTLLDLALFTVFAVVVHLPPLVANVLSTSITLCISFVLNRVFVFRTERSVQRTVVQFVAVTLFSGLVVQSAVIWGVLHVGAVLVPGLSHDILAPLAKICAMGVGMIFNFLAYRWLFSSREPKRPPTLSE